MNIDNTKINTIVTTCKAKNTVSNELGKIMLQIVDGVYINNWPKSSHSSLLKDEIKDYALLRLLQNWKFWNRGNALGFYNYCVNRYMKYYLIKYAEEEAESLINEEGDVLEIGIWDDNFDQVRYSGELLDLEPIERVGAIPGSLKHLSVAEKKKRHKAQQKAWYEKRKIKP